MRKFDGISVPFKSYKEVREHLYDFKKVLPRGHRWMMPGVVTVRMRRQQKAPGICFALSLEKGALVFCIDNGAAAR